MIKIFIIVLMMSVLIAPAMGEDNQSTNNTTYRVFVDHTYGFYRVYEANSDRSVEYENRTLNISKGDTVIWTNDAVPDTKLTILNKQNLWGKHGGELRWNYKQFKYTFNKSGIYDMYISEYSRFQQRIIVGPIEITDVTNKTINQTDVNNSDNKTKTNTSNSSIPVTVPLEKKPGTGVIVLLTVTSLLIYIFERKIK